MAWRDALATFATAQTGTLSTAHTDIIDTLASGQANIAPWFKFEVSTAFTQTGTTAGLNVQLQTSDSAAFTTATDVTLVTSQTFSTSQLTAGRFWAVRVPPGVKRYIRAYNAVTQNAGNGFTGGAWNSYLVPDVDITLDKRYMLGQY